ncbi:MAG: hypothetical protein O7F13_07230, partial [Gammaproteobacteria bacterium]|nr:hypothetical protein [Gammaproteobacteria bacterium]
NEALAEASEAVAEAAEEQEQKESSESEAAGDASASESQASTGQSSSSGSNNAAGDSDDTGGEAGAEAAASNVAANAPDRGDQDASSGQQRSSGDTSEAGAQPADAAQVAAGQTGASGEDSTTEDAASGEENLQAATEATDGARQALQGLIDMIAASQMAASGISSATGADNDQMDDASGGLPGDIGSPEYQEALKKAVGEALSEAARQIEKASGALAEAARQSQDDESADSEPRSVAAGSERTGQRAESQGASDDVSGDELAARLAEMRGLAEVMNAINDGMQGAEQGGLASANRQASTRLILEGDTTAIPGSILLPGGISLPLGLGLPGMLGQPTGDGGEIPGAVLVAGGGFESGSDRPVYDDGQGSAGSGSGAVVIIAGEQSSSDRVALLDTRLSGSLTVFDGVILASQGTKMGSSGGAGGGFGEQGQDTGIAGASGQPGFEGEGPMIAGSGQTPGDADEGKGTSLVKGNDTGPGGRQSGSDALLSPPPEDIPDGSDDDIVARQLREAAENERDPVLRDKLWDEYRAYKKATGG